MSFAGRLRSTRTSLASVNWVAVVGVEEVEVHLVAPDLGGVDRVLEPRRPELGRAGDGTGGGAAGRRVADQRGGDAEHDDDQGDLGPQRAAKQQPGPPGLLAPIREASKRRHEPLAVDGPEPDQDQEQRRLDQDRPAESGLDQVAERADVDDRLDHAGGANAITQPRASGEKRSNAPASSLLLSAA